MQLQRKCPLTTAILIQTVPRKTEATKAVEGKITAGKKQSNGYVPSTKDKWGLGEYRLWATAFVNCRRCKHEPFSIAYFYEDSTCIILGFCVFNFFSEKNKESGMKKCLLNTALMGAKCVLSVP